jgi:hypothetical protein
MEPEGSLPYSQDLRMVSILNQMNPAHITSSYSSKINFNIISRLFLGLPNGLFPSGFPTKLSYPVCVT